MLESKGLGSTVSEQNGTRLSAELMLQQGDCIEMGGWQGGHKGLLGASVQEFGRQRLSWSRRPLLPPAVLGSSREASVFSHRGRCELQLEVLILEDAVESRATLGARKWPTAVTAAVLGEFRKESQLRGRGHM